MSAPAIRGWCPGALRPMMSGDGLVVRIRAHGGRLTSAQLAGIAALARRFGNGQIDLSARANLQLRGVAEAGHPALIDGLRGLGLIDDSLAAEARRNILVTPFWKAGDGTAELAAALEEALADAPPLPGKFGYAIDTGPAPVLGAASADIRLERDAAGGFVLRADGAAEGTPVGAADAPARVVALARWFVETGGVQGGRGRMAAHLGRGAALPDGFAPTVAPALAAPAPAPGHCPAGFLTALAFGQTDAATLAAIAALVPAVRLTPWRMLLLEGLGEAPAIAGLIADPADPVLRVTACTGAPGCPQARAATRPLARALAVRVPQGAHLHVSGCAKGCAHPGPCALTLTATGAGFALVRGGTAAAEPVRTGLPAEVLLSDPTLFET